VEVTWPEQIQLERGSPVFYQGVDIGRVDEVVLRQDAPDRAAVVAVTLAIHDPAVSLRSADRFHLSSRSGVPVVEIQPARQPSPPLRSGETVVGVPPLLTRMEQRIEEAIESIGEVALEAMGSAVDALGEIGGETGGEIGGEIEGEIEFDKSEPGMAPH
jgi:ABC-type transporter Mla subunit MlaD